MDEAAMVSHYDETKHVNYETNWVWQRGTSPAVMVKTYRCLDCAGILEPMALYGL